MPVDRATPFLLPPSLQEWLPDDHLARFVADVVEDLDLTPLERAYAGRGSKAYHPGMLLALLFYGYATGVFSSRKLEAATYDSIAFRFICANTHPDHDTIATFRRRFLPLLDQYFLEILVLAGEMGLLALGAVSIDGSKMKANASKHKALSYGYASKLEEQLRQEVRRLLEMAEEVDRQEEAEHVDIPEELRRREDRIKAIRAAKKRIEARAAERYEEEKAAHEEKLAQRKAKQEATGKKLGGKPPKAPEPEVRDKDQVNLTDPESRIMPTSGGSFEQAYNVEAAVDLASHLIVAQHVTQSTNDTHEFKSVLERLAALPEHLGRVHTALADNGFYSEDNVKAALDLGVEPLIALGRQAHNVPLEMRLARPDPPGEDATPLERMAYRLKTPEGRALYGKRKSTVEAVFGMVKRVLGFRQFMLRGLAKVSGEWTLVSIAWNLRRMFRMAQGAGERSGTGTSIAFG